MKTLNGYYTGRKAKIGGICFDDIGRVHIFTGYCSGCNGKVLMTIAEAEDFANKYRTEHTRNKRLFKKIEKHTI